MESETEELLKKYLKGQIWKQRISLLSSLLFIFFLIMSAWFSYNKLLPTLNEQIKNTTSLLEKMTTISQPSLNQSKLFKDLGKELEGQLEQQLQQTFTEKEQPKPSEKTRPHFQTD